MQSFTVKTLALLFALALIGACTSSGQVNETLTPNANQQSASSGNDPISSNALAADQPTSPTQNVTNAQTQSGTQVAALNTSEAVTFLPVEGAPQSTVTELSKLIRKSAEIHSLAVLAATQPGAKYKVKGYFSALNDGSGTLLIYIWDIFDNSGKRLHRINGQERSTSTKANPWQAISDDELSRVADATAQRLKSWIETN
ncbi:MAG: hypothetical protein AAF478_01600 [Pseudomonadota bacterium]